ncbi:MAG: twin-arginine translocase TatA/TatE family subunit [Phycisphaerales bacterium]|jgi:sec-independent protein translocase protein TatA
MPTLAIVNAPLALIGPLGWPEIGAILLIAVLLFGRRLPDVGRNVGKAIIEFKRGVKGITDEIEEESRKDDQRDVQGDTQAGRSPAKPELEAPRGTAYHEPAGGDVGQPDPQYNPAPARPEANPGDGQPRTS